MSQDDDDFFTQLGIEPREPARITGRRLDAARARRREERARRRRKRRRRLITALVLVLVLASVAGVGYAAYKHAGIEGFMSSPKDYSGAGEGEVVVNIPDGSSGKDIARILADAGVVASAVSPRGPGEHACARGLPLPPRNFSVILAPRLPKPLLCLTPAGPSGRRTSPAGSIRPPRALLCNDVSIRLPPGLSPLLPVPSSASCC